jgi:hypothetical protein
MAELMLRLLLIILLIVLVVGALPPWPYPRSASC